MRRYLAIVIMVSALVAASASPAAAVTNGTPDYEGKFSYVGLLANANWICTGTLIAPTVILTAGHCIDNFGGPSAAASVMVSFAVENDFSAFTYNTTASAMYRDPVGYDVGLVYLNEYEGMSGLGSGFLPDEWAVESLPNKTPLIAVGYGSNGYAPNGGPPQAVGGGTRMWATTEFINNNHAYAPQFLKLSTNPGQEKGGICHGDSGGPVFSPETGAILGIASWGGQNCNRLSYAQRMDLPYVQSWVSVCLGGHEVCPQDPNWWS